MHFFSDSYKSQSTWKRFFLTEWSSKVGKRNVFVFSLNQLFLIFLKRYAQYQKEEIFFSWSQQDLQWAVKLLFHQKAHLLFMTYPVARSKFKTFRVVWNKNSLFRFWTAIIAAISLLWDRSDYIVNDWRLVSAFNS